jgi:acetyltransferase-like isoleucine patch superfamily enzyme
MAQAWTPGIHWLARRCAEWLAPPHLDRVALAYLNPLGYISTQAQVYHRALFAGLHVFIGDGAVLFQHDGGGIMRLDDNVAIHPQAILENGAGAEIVIGKNTSVHPWCQLRAHLSSIEIGAGVMIAAGCALYSYDHGIAGGSTIREQALTSRGPIIVDEGAWLGTGSIVLSGVRIGKGAVIGAGSVVTRDVPEFAIAVGNPARVMKYRNTSLPN